MRTWWNIRILVAACWIGMTAVPVAHAAEAAGVHCATPLTGAAETPPICIARKNFNEDVCRAIETLARRHELPAGFFARLIWQESRFDPNAVSPAGAEGIAQFIPSTARLRALADPFNPADALARSAAYLAEMKDRFGTLGLAAIGYNAGENRARLFLDGEPFMPWETRHYVRIITGLDVEHWKTPPEEMPDFALAEDKPFREACLELAVNSRMSAFRMEAGDWKPWGVQLGAHVSRSVAERIFERVQDRYPVLQDEEPLFVADRNRSFGSRSRITVRVGRETREESQALCRTIRQAGGFCLVVRN